MRQCTVNSEESGLRLDKFLVGKLPELSRSRVQSLILGGHVRCGSLTMQDASDKVKPGEIYEVTIPEVAPTHHVAQAIALDVAYEDADFLVINKPPGLTVHPGAGNPDNTLVNALLAHCGDSLSGIGGVARPGIVHRIDKDTSGLLVVAKNDAAHLALSAQLAARTLKRTYLALTWGAVKNPQGTLTGNIGRSPVNRKKMAVVKTGGKPAATRYTVLAQTPLFSLLECQLDTGRTHQIRVHLTHIGHPLVGDPVYGQSTKQRLNASSYKALPQEALTTLLAFHRQALHAKALELVHPTSGENMQFSAPLPKDMETLLSALSIPLK